MKNESEWVGAVKAERKWSSRCVAQREAGEWRDKAGEKKVTSGCFNNFNLPQVNWDEISTNSEVP